MTDLWGSKGEVPLEFGVGVDQYKKKIKFEIWIPYLSLRNLFHIFLYSL